MSKQSTSPEVEDHSLEKTPPDSSSQSTTPENPDASSDLLKGTVFAIRKLIQDLTMEYAKGNLRTVHKSQALNPDSEPDSVIGNTILLDIGDRNFILMSEGLLKEEDTDEIKSVKDILIVKRGKNEVTFYFNDRCVRVQPHPGSDFQDGTTFLVDPTNCTEEVTEHNKYLAVLNKKLQQYLELLKLASERFEAEKVAHEAGSRDLGKFLESL